RDLDVPPAARAEVRVFTLKKADAAQLANSLQQLFLGTGGVGATGPGAIPGGVPGQAGTQGRQVLLPITLGGYTPEGLPLIQLRITIDDRTNSLIVAGSVND